WSTHTRRARGRTTAPRDGTAGAVLSMSAGEPLKGSTASPANSRPPHLLPHGDVHPSYKGGEHVDEIEIGEREEEGRNRKADEREREMDGRQVEKPFLRVAVQPGLGQSAPQPLHTHDPTDYQRTPQDQPRHPEFGADLDERVVRRGPP